MGLLNVSHVAAWDWRGDYLHSKTEFSFAFDDDESPYLGVYVFVVFDFGNVGIIVGEVCIVVSHGIQPIQSVGACRLREENRKDLCSCQ